MRCWGDNAYGQLGDGTTTVRPRPVDVVGLTSGVAQVSAGYISTCAVTTAGGVKCWGYGQDGRLGDGTSTTSTTPVDVVGLTSGVASVSVGALSACAVTTAGAVTCWGAGSSGLLGDGQGRTSPVPVDVVGLTSGVRTVSTGSNHACALATGGDVSCWGSNTYGELGNGRDGATGYRYTPVTVRGLGGADATSLDAADNTTCVTADAGRVLCWGDNAGGELGVAAGDSHVTRPTRVAGLRGVSSVEGGDDMRCAVGEHRTSCWGTTTTGALGDGTDEPHTTPAPVVDLTGPTTVVSTSGDHTCTVNAAGRVFCWGENGYGQLGNGTRTPSSTPVRVGAFG